MPRSLQLPELHAPWIGNMVSAEGIWDTLTHLHVINCNAKDPLQIECIRSTVIYAFCLNFALPFLLLDTTYCAMTAQIALHP